MVIEKAKRVLFYLSVLLLISCASGSAIVTGTKRPPIDMTQVKLYLEPPEKYELIGLVKASSDSGWTEQGSQDYAIQELKTQAAKLGANGILIVGTGQHTTSVVASNGQGGAERITFEGNYNARGSFSADGKMITMVQGNQGQYRIAVLDLHSRSTQVLTSGALDESPSFAPNGKAIIYARRELGKEILSTVSVDGLNKRNITQTTGQVREPVWSPRQ